MCENVRTAGTLTHDLFPCIPPIFVPRTIIPGRSTDVATSGETLLARTNVVSHGGIGSIVKAARELVSTRLEFGNHRATSNLENPDVRDGMKLFITHPLTYYVRSFDPKRKRLRNSTYVKLIGYAKSSLRRLVEYSRSIVSAKSRRNCHHGFHIFSSSFSLSLSLSR